MSLISYKRTFRITAAHFSHQDCYDLLWDEDSAPGGGDWMFLVRNTHGHDFKIEITVGGNVPTAEGLDWVISDEELEYNIDKWRNINLSTHPDFMGPRIRATTENIARVLADKIQALSKEIQWTEVSVWEGPDIVATATSAVDLGEILDSQQEWLTTHG